RGSGAAPAPRPTPRAPGRATLLRVERLRPGAAQPPGEHEARPEILPQLLNGARSKEPRMRAGSIHGPVESQATLRIRRSGARDRRGPPTHVRMLNLAVGMPGIWEIVILAGILLLLFGAKKLPELARAMGSSITQFKK